MLFNSTKIRPYVYLCTHRVTGNFYIGYRERNVFLGRTSDVDFPKYKTSSTIVRPAFDEYDWEIIAEFETGADAEYFEQQMIYENWDNPQLLNKRCFFKNAKKFRSNTKGRDPWNKGKKCPQLANNEPWIKNHTGVITRSDETKQKLRQANLGKVVSMETRVKQSTSMVGKNKGKKLGPRSEEFKNKLRKPKPKLVSRIIDKKLMDMPNFAKWNKKQGHYED